MTDAYTYIAKPTGTPYTNVNTVGGKEQYDQPNLMYDDLNVFYDGINQNAYTKIAKPTTTQVVASAGLYYGFGAFTYSGGQPLGQSEWTKVAKPTN